MPMCVPIKELKDTAAFTKTVNEAPGPITITKNGYDEFVVMRSGDYEAMQLELAKTKLMNRIARAEHEYATGQYSDGEEFFRSLREKYGL